MHNLFLTESLFPITSIVEEEHWRHGYSHVGGGDRTGHVILKDGKKVNWMVRPGGLAWLKFENGKKMYLAGVR